MKKLFVSIASLLLVAGCAQKLRPSTASNEADYSGRIVGLQGLVGSDDMVGTDYIDRIQEVRNATGLVSCPEWSGSGLLVAPGILMTNNHVLPNKEVASGSFLEMGYESKDGSFQVPVVFALLPSHFFVTNKELDFTLVAVAPLSENKTFVPLSKYGTVRVAAYNEEVPTPVAIGDYVTIVQHPRAGFKKVALRDNQIVGVFADFLYYTADTQPGSSGSGVFNDNMELIAIHHAGVPVLDPYGRLFAYAANEGVRISSIQRYLKKVGVKGVLGL